MTGDRPGRPPRPTGGGTPPLTAGRASRPATRTDTGLPAGNARAPSLLGRFFGKGGKGGDAKPAAAPPVAARSAPQRRLGPPVQPDTPPDALAARVLQAGRLVTQPDGLWLPAVRESMVALFEDGLLLVSREHANHPHVRSFLKLLLHESSSYQHLPPHHVDMAVIDRLHGSGAAGAGRGSTRQTAVQASRAGGGDLEPMEREIVALIDLAARRSVSDIHIMAEPSGTMVRFRENGVMVDFTRWTWDRGRDFCAAAYTMAGEADANYMPDEPQGARISTIDKALPSGVQSCRLQFNALAGRGRYLVIRLLYEAKQGLSGSLTDLGYHPRQDHQVARMRIAPTGMVIVAGPTGSGKSTTLKQCLLLLLEERQHKINVISVEDPPEYVIGGVRQVPVTNANTPKERREAFVRAIMSAMRQDPDVILIGEVRDEESAKLVVEAAMTGHQVYTTVHANDALTIPRRLIKIGVDGADVFDPTIVVGLVGQRLVRTVCTSCALDVGRADGERLLGEEVWHRLRKVADPAAATIRTMRPGGCPACSGTGESKRVVVAETVCPDETFMSLMDQGKKIEAKHHWLTRLDGFTMMNHAIHKMKAGLVAPTEVERVMGALDWDLASLTSL